MNEPYQTRLKRLHMRSWRRGTKEMDLILGPFWDAHGASLSGSELDDYERLLSENDQDLYQWASGQADAPPDLKSILGRILNEKT